MLVTSERYEGTRKCWSDKYTTSASSEVRNFIKYELGYGGEVVGLSTQNQDIQYLEVVTHVLGKRDVTRYEGTKEELQQFFEIAQIANCYEQMLTNTNFETIIDDMMEATKGIPLYVAMSAGIFKSRPLSRIALGWICSFNNPDFLESILKSKNTLDDLMCAHELICQGASQEDIGMLLL